MIKHGTKYINESEWFDDLSLDGVIDDKTGRLLVLPPIGAEVTVRFIEDVPCANHDFNSDEDVILDGEVIRYSKTNPGVFLIMFHGGWQQPCGWDCSSEVRIPGDNGNKCYWLHIEEEEVYLKGAQRIQESEDDDLGWAQDIVNQNPIPSRVKLGDGKRFSIPGHGKYSKGWDNFVGWNYWKDVVRVDSKAGELCYVINDISYGDIYIPMAEFRPNEISFDRLNESEEDSLEWAQDLVSGNPSMKFSKAFNLLDSEDVISVSGELTNDDFESPETLCNLNGDKFEVFQKNRGNIQLRWLSPRDERPAGWQKVTNYGGPEHTDNLVLYHGSDAGFNDDNLDITFIEKADHPF